MTTKRKLRRRVTPATAAIHPVDVVVNETIVKHAHGARTRKEQKETLRLASRRRVAKKLYDAVEKELESQARNGTRPSHRRVAEMCEEHAKQLCKTLALEASAEKED